MELEKLKILEARIESILNQHAKVCEERDRLSEQLEEMKTRLVDQERERTEIKNRVERILGRLDGVGLG